MPRGRSRTPRGPGVLRGAGPGCLRGRSCAPRGRFCGGELVLGASGDRVALWGGNPASPGPVLLGGGGGRSWVPPEIGLHCGGPVLHPPGPVPVPSLGWQDAGCSGYPGGAAPGLLGVAELATPGPSGLASESGCWHCLAVPGGPILPAWPGAGHCLVPAPGALCAPRVALQSITSGQASPQRSGSVLAGPLGQAGPSRGGRAPTAAPSQLGEQDPLPLMGGPGHKCTFTSHP